MRTFARSATLVEPQASAAECAGSSAASTTEASDRAIWSMGWPVIGLRFSNYLPAFGLQKSPPIKLP
ncbi:hypothetical protein [Ruegeria faecimaris]|uniref:hypothetical protein n=1 Tax=Ruegeria faecimaris TaxID=686389 RepID=UPI0024920650|nr:hypothetical protein [Ruegeria faecimaris]